MRSFRASRAAASERPSNGTSALVTAALLGVIVGSLASLQWGQRFSKAAPVVCAPATCPTCVAVLPTSAAVASAGAPNEPPGGVWRPAGREGAGNAALQAVLKQVAINNEVLVAVSNNALITPDGKFGMLQTWVECVQRSGVKNFMVIALDEHTAHAMEQIGVATWRAAAAQLADKNQDNHGISSQKFHLIRDFLELGYRVLLSDVDIVTLQNPFNFLARDSDIEGLSDGFDERTAYGYVDGIDDPSMGWARYAQTIRIFVLNSGLFYIQPSNRTVNLMDRINEYLRHNKAWDQTVYNEMIWYPSHGSSKNSQVSVRVMDHLMFMNSKTLFKFQRKDPVGKNRLPVMVHINYHPDKWERMKAVVRRWVDGDTHALDGFPDGSEK